MEENTRLRQRREMMRRFRGEDGAQEGLIEKLKKFHWGFYVLVGGAVWAIIQVIRSVLYVFN